MDIGESHLIMAYAAVIGIHSAYLTYVGVKYYKARSYAPAAGTMSATGFGAPAYAAADSPRGIGGWLSLVALGLGFSLLLLSFGVVAGIVAVIPANLRSIAEGVPGAALFEIVTLAASAILLAGYIYLNILFYKKKRTFPRYMIAAIALSICLGVIEYALCPGDAFGSDWGDLSTRLAVQGLWSFFTGMLWIMYLLRSRRVKATFVN